MLFIAHDLSMVRYVSDRMAVMYLGSARRDRPVRRGVLRVRSIRTRRRSSHRTRSRTRAPSATRATIPIKGEIPSPVNVAAGCRFAKRCPHVMDVCRSVTPELREIAGAQGERRVACHLYETGEPGSGTVSGTDRAHQNSGAAGKVGA